MREGEEDSTGADTKVVEVDTRVEEDTAGEADMGEEEEGDINNKEEEETLIDH